MMNGYPEHAAQEEGGAVQPLHSEDRAGILRSPSCLMMVEKVDSWREVSVPPQLGQGEEVFIWSSAFRASNCWSHSSHL